VRKDSRADDQARTPRCAARRRWPTGPCQVNLGARGRAPRAGRVHVAPALRVGLLFGTMTNRAVQLVLQYDGSDFAGWQRQPSQRTVQGVLESALQRLTGTHVDVIGAGRTDAGVHARGQAAGVIVPVRWTIPELRRALNAVLPADVWVASAHEMLPTFHARYSATSRRYIYRVGIDDEARGPFRRRWEHTVEGRIDRRRLSDATRLLVGEHCFIAFAVRGTAPANDTHRCTVTLAEWRDQDGRLEFAIEANRFLHHMVRFLVGTVLDVATGRRDVDHVTRLLQASSNDEVSPPAPAHALFLDAVRYPQALYLHQRAA
jgi:tRNA pseudouridine38-40 synthase